MAAPDSFTYRRAQQLAWRVNRVPAREKRAAGNAVLKALRAWLAEKK